MNAKDIRRVLQIHKDELKAKYGVTQISLFGSYVRNEQNENSDVDILVEFAEPIDLLTFVNLKNYLSDFLKINVDLVMKRALKPKIGQRVLEEAVRA